MSISFAILRLSTDSRRDLLVAAFLNTSRERSVLKEVYQQRESDSVDIIVIIGNSARSTAHRCSLSRHPPAHLLWNENSGAHSHQLHARPARLLIRWRPFGNRSNRLSDRGNGFFTWHIVSPPEATGLFFLKGSTVVATDILG